MKADSHVHSYFSHDSQTPPEDLIRRGIELGLDEITFTEHIDKNKIVDCDCEKYFVELQPLKEKYKDQITVRLGMEFGLEQHTLEEFRELAQRYDFEFIIASTHNVNTVELWTGDFAVGRDQVTFHRDYYENMYEIVKNFKDYSVVGHLDYVKRYDPYGEYPDELVMDYVDKILKQVIADGKGIEVNCSCYKYHVGDLTPSRKILKRYLELGGKILTIGSDAHNTEYLADHFDDAKAILREIGYTQFCTFENRKPVFHEL